MLLRIAAGHCAAQGMANEKPVFNLRESHVNRICLIDAKDRQVEGHFDENACKASVRKILQQRRISFGFNFSTRIKYQAIGRFHTALRAKYCHTVFPGNDISCLRVALLSFCIGMIIVKCVDVKAAGQQQDKSRQSNQRDPQFFVGFEFHLLSPLFE